MIHVLHTKKAHLPDSGADAARADAVALEARAVEETDAHTDAALAAHIEELGAAEMRKLAEEPPSPPDEWTTVANPRRRCRDKKKSASDDKSDGDAASLATAGSA